jgi:hypothetical protein
MCETSMESYSTPRVSLKKKIQDVERVNTPATCEFHDVPTAVQIYTFIRPRFPLLEFNLT